jgi:hypothetical protein
MELKGVLEELLDVQSGTSKAGKDWQSREFVINTGDQYKPHICIKLFGDKVTLIDIFNIGDAINVEVNVSSSKFKDRWFTNIDAWKIDKATTPPAPSPKVDEESDVLPF